MGAVFYASRERLLSREGSQDRTIADAFTADALVVTLPIRFHTDGAVNVTILGSGSELRSAAETVRQRVDVTVLSVRDG